MRTGLLSVTIIVFMILTPHAWASVSVTSPSFKKYVLGESCKEVVSNGRDNMPMLTVYVINKTEPMHISFGSDQHIHDSVFNECLIHPQMTIRKAIDALIRETISKDVESR
jgi:hypothetical protein